MAMVGWGHLVELPIGFEKLRLPGHSHANVKSHSREFDHFDQSRIRWFGWWRKYAAGQSPVSKSKRGSIPLPPGRAALLGIVLQSFDEPGFFGFYRAAGD